MKVKRLFLLLLVLVFLAGCAAFADPKATKGGTIKVGMTQEQVVQEWGKPYKVNTSGGQYGEREQWIYGYRSYHRGFVSKYYLYFRDGNLTSWQTRDTR